jgi:hypothetical protein
LNIANFIQGECSVVVDGNTFPVNAPLSESEKQAQYSKLISTKKANGQDDLLSHQRTLKAFGQTEYAPECNKCNVKEPKDEKFLKCGRCEAVVYCTKECQKNDWPVHKTVCTPSM